MSNCSHCKKELPKGKPILCCTGGQFCGYDCMDLFHGDEVGKTRKEINKVFEEWLNKVENSGNLTGVEFAQITREALKK